jgi:hypothetical protein
MKENQGLRENNSLRHDGCYFNGRVPLANFMKTISSPPPAPICVWVFTSDTIRPGPVAPSIILDKGGRLSHRTDRFFRVARVFLSGLIDGSAFHNDSLGREVSVLFTSNGPLIYRWESKNQEPPARS